MQTKRLRNDGLCPAPARASCCTALLVAAQSVSADRPREPTRRVGSHLRPASAAFNAVRDRCDHDHANGSRVDERPWAKGEAGLEQNWVLGDFETWIKKIDREQGGRREGLQQAFGVTFRRLDFEQLRPATAPASCRIEAIITTPTDGEWMSAQEALDCLGLGFANAAQAICAHAFAGLVQAKARRFLVPGTPDDDDVELPREFWSRSEEATWHDWRTGHFEATLDDRRFEAFGVQFRRSDIEQLKPAIAASSTAQLSPRQRRVLRTVFIGHGRRSKTFAMMHRHGRQA